MAGVVCVWANLPDELKTWYEEDFLPEMRERNSRYTVHCELSESGFEGEPIGKLDAPWSLFSLYEVDDLQKANGGIHDTANHPSEEMLAGPLARATFEAHTYRELASVKQDDWIEDASRIIAISAIEWRVTAEKKDEVLEWYISSVIPLIMKSPDTLRYRVFEVDTAAVLQGESCAAKETDALHTFLSLIELESDQWPWELIFELAEDKKWKAYFENPDVVKWQTSLYLAERVYD